MTKLPPPTGVWSIIFYLLADVKGGVSNFWYSMLTFEITQKKHAPSPKRSRSYFDSSAPHIDTHPRQRLVLWNKAKPMLLTYREETNQPRRLIVGLPTLWVLSSAGKLIRYLHGSYFFPYRNTVSTPDARSGVTKYHRTHYNQWCLHWMPHHGTTNPRQ